MVYTNEGVAHAVSGAKQVIDDGEILVAVRLGEGDARRAVAEHEERERLLGAPAPELVGARWLNCDSPLTWQDLKGRVVLLDFWSSVKPHSAHVVHMPRLRELHAEYAERGFTVIGAFLDRSGEGRELDQFLQDDRVTFPMMVDRGETTKPYLVGRRPTYFLVDREGNVTWSGPRPPTNEQIEQLLGDGAANSAK